MALLKTLEINDRFKLGNQIIFYLCSPFRREGEKAPKNIVNKITISWW